MGVVEPNLRFQRSLELNVEHASLLGHLGVQLFSSDLGKNESWGRSSVPEVSGTLERGWIVFVSIFLQKILLYLKRPLALLGYVIETWLNLLSSNGGFAMLLLNLVKGTLVIPNKDSENFRTVLGHIDPRVDLDKKIVDDGDNFKYAASLSLMAAKISYENEAFVRNVIEEHWKMKFLGRFIFWNCYKNKPSTHAIMFRDTIRNPNLIVIAFRGTSPFDMDEWLTDVDVSFHELKGVGKIHSGFMKALGLQGNATWPKEIDADSSKHQYAYYTLRKKLKKLLKKHKGSEFILTGHSLGGALAILFVWVLVMHDEAWLLERLNGVYTFGQPRVGNGELGKFMEEKLRFYGVKHWRYVYANDLVPRCPYDYRSLWYKHFGGCLHFNSWYEGKAVLEEPNKNYFSLYWAIPKRLNAACELIRSFIIPYTKGKDFKEGWFMGLLRLIGLGFPGLVDHFIQDYNNSTRLGTVHPFVSKKFMHNL